MKLMAIDIERSSRMDFMRNPDDSALQSFEREISKNISQNNSQSVWDAWQYAQSLDYQHPGQSKNLYLAHPLRVATLFAQLVKPFNVMGVVTSLLHNIQELSDVDQASISKQVGEEVAMAISLLTVNRALQWDDEYKEEYYRKISDSSLFVRQVKIVDKLDNMFLLCLNPSEEVRYKYLREIEKWLLPLTKTSLPVVTDYLTTLIENNRAVGHIPLHSEISKEVT